MSDPNPLRVLITGFGPFPGVPDNATARLVPLLAGALKERWPHLDVIAEGIETENQLARLCELGCPSGQGYFFSKPLDPSTFRHWNDTQREVKRS